MTAAKKIPSTMPAPANDEYDDREEITIERRVKVPAARRATTRMTTVDERLLAIARGELEPDDPFGGLIPIYENDGDGATEDADDHWLFLGSGPESSGASEGLFGDTVPILRALPDELLAMGLAPRTALFASHIDGKRTVQELLEICAIDDLTGLELVDELLRFGAIDLR